MALPVWPPPSQEVPWLTVEQAQSMSAKLWWQACLTAGGVGLAPGDAWQNAFFPAPSSDALWTLAAGNRAQAPGAREWLPRVHNPAQVLSLAELEPPAASAALEGHMLESLPEPLRVEALTAAPSPSKVARGSPGKDLHSAETYEHKAETRASWRAAAETGSAKDVRTVPAPEIPDPVYINRAFQKTLDVDSLLGNEMPFYVRSELVGLPPTLSKGDETWLPTSGLGLPSRGAALHNLGLCKPCAWFWKPQKCDRHEDCEFCHACPPEALHRRMQERKKMARRIQRSNARFKSCLLTEDVEQKAC